jgi:hypothetical protein
MQEAVSDWLTPALKAGGGAIVLASPANWRAARMRLRTNGLNPSDLEAQGRIVVLDVFEFLSDFMADGRPDADVFQDRLASAVARVRASADFPEIRAWGEAVDILRENRNVLAAQFLESLWNEGIEKHDLRLLCSYHVDPLDPATHGGRLSEFAANHGRLIPARDYSQLNYAIEDALVDVVGADGAATMLTEFWQRPTTIAMPVAQRLLMYLQDHNPRLANRVFARARAHYDLERADPAVIIA